MKKELFVIPFALVAAQEAKGDFWGGDLPLLAQIVTNTLQTLSQLRTQTEMMEYQTAGINDRITRITTIASVIQPGQWDQWKDPAESLRRLRLIYETLPKEYHSEKSDLIEREISESMNLVARIAPQATTTFQSGKELESRGANSSPAVAQKLTASGMGTMVAMEAQNQVIQSHITSLLAQTLADANEKETRSVVSRGQCFTNVRDNLGSHDGKFSTHVFPKEMQ